MTDFPQNHRDAIPGETTPISARDSTTGEVVPNVGDTANNAIRTFVVGGGGGGTQYADGTTFVPNTSIGTLDLGVVDDGTVPVPTVSAMTGLRIDPSTHGVICGPQWGATAQGPGVEFGNIPLALLSNDLGSRWQPLTIDETGRLQVSGTLAISSGSITVHQAFISQQLTFVADDTQSTGTTLQNPQTKLSVVFTADGTVTAGTVTVSVLDQPGNSSAPVITLTPADLGVLKPATVDFPFLGVQVAVTGLVLGTATFVRVGLTSAP